MHLNDLPDYMSAVYDLIAYVTGIDGGRIIRGNQSREVLPADNDYIVYTPITQQRIGSNVAVLYAEGVDPADNAPEVNTKLLRVNLQIDCYGDKAFAYAQGLETFAEAGRCNDWLNQSELGIRVLTCSDPIDGTLVDDTRQYIPRWITTLSICFESSITDEIPWIEEVEVIPMPKYDPAPGPSWEGTQLVNVDVVYPPNDKE